MGYDEVMYAGEKRNLSCSTDLTFTRLEWVNKTDNRVLKTTAVGNRVDLLIPSLSTRHNGNKLACRIVTSCGTDEKSITLNITSEHYVCVWGGEAWWPSGQDICPRTLKVVRSSPTSAWYFFIMHQPPSSPSCKMGTSLIWLGGHNH